MATRTVEYFDALLERALASMIGWGRATKVGLGNPEEVAIGVETCKRTSNKRGWDAEPGPPSHKRGGGGVAL